MQVVLLVLLYHRSTVSLQPSVILIRFDIFSVIDCLDYKMSEN